MLTSEEQDWAYEAVQLVKLIQIRLDDGAEFKHATNWDASGFFQDQKARVTQYKTNTRMTKRQMIALRGILKTGLRGGVMRKRDRIPTSQYCTDGDHIDCYDRSCECSCHRGAAA